MGAKEKHPIQLNGPGGTKKNVLSAKLTRIWLNVSYCYFLEKNFKMVWNYLQFEYNVIAYENKNDLWCEFETNS